MVLNFRLRSYTSNVMIYEGAKGHVNIIGIVHRLQSMYRWNFVLFFLFRIKLMVYKEQEPGRLYSCRLHTFPGALPYIWWRKLRPGKNRSGQIRAGIRKKKPAAVIPTTRKWVQSYPVLRNTLQVFVQDKFMKSSWGYANLKCQVLRRERALVVLIEGNNLLRRVRRV